MDREISAIDFTNIKKQILRNVDNSKKGSIDIPIVGLLDKINQENDFVTTSSCSGRVIVISQLSHHVEKKNCHWVYNSHEYIEEDEFLASIKQADGYLTLKFEPFVLHVQSRSLASAKNLLTVALSSGYRNSGIVLGKHGKIVVGVRSTSNFEVVLSDGKNIIVSDEFLKYSIKILNEKMSKNFDQIKRFEEAVSKLLGSKS